MADSLCVPLAAKPHSLCENKLNVLAVSQNSRVSLSHRAGPVRALDSDVPHPLHKGAVNVKSRKSYDEWDSWTAEFAGAANFPFLLLQLHQIILNACNLMAGNKTALLAVPCLKRETEVAVVQTLGVISIFVVITQLAKGAAMPLPQYVATSVVVVAGLILNFLNYYGMLNKTIWILWEDFMTVGGFSVLPQEHMANFRKMVSNS
ncbi:Maltose excess protein 1 [Hibiscus syriacus]|uniref:Maltose excess protein 1 n=1 Tax=Hibiscus syriacus TaxID=106335 RepID=A0A6A2X2X1_HIBSY|nr:Maltose excess protein 1 [Hibiscus syriacus]